LQSFPCRLDNLLDIYKPRGDVKLPAHGEEYYLPFNLVPAAPLRRSRLCTFSQFEHAL
jgi:hypothetical protein